MGKTLKAYCFCARLKHRRKRLGLSLRELAKLTGIHNSTISRYESGRHLPSPERLDKLAEALAVNPEWLTGRSDDMEMKIDMENTDTFTGARSRFRKALGNFFEELARLFPRPGAGGFIPYKPHVFMGLPPRVDKPKTSPPPERK